MLQGGFYLQGGKYDSSEKLQKQRPFPVKINKFWHS